MEDRAGMVKLISERIALLFADITTGQALLARKHEVESAILDTFNDCKNHIDRALIYGDILKLLISFVCDIDYGNDFKLMADCIGIIVDTDKTTGRTNKSNVYAQTYRIKILDTVIDNVFKYFLDDIEKIQFYYTDKPMNVDPFKSVTELIKNICDRLGISGHSILRPQLNANIEARIKNLTSEMGIKINPSDKTKLDSIIVNQQSLLSVKWGDIKDGLYKSIRQKIPRSVYRERKAQLDKIAKSMQIAAETPKTSN